MGRGWGGGERRGWEEEGSKKTIEQRHISKYRFLSPSSSSRPRFHVARTASTAQYVQ